MTDFILYAILGLSTGSIYVLSALGLVLVKRTSGIINFAHGALGLVGTYVFWELRDNYQTGLVVALVAGLAVSGSLGVITYWFVMRRLLSSSVLMQLIGTLAVSTIIVAVAGILYPAESYLVPPLLPTQTVAIGDKTVGLDRLCVIGGVLVGVLVLALVYQRTSFGRATSAVAENPVAAAALGISQDQVSALNWLIGGVLGGLAGIVIAPVSGLAPTTATELLVPALAAAVVGNFSSFTRTLAGGLFIGVVQSEMAQFGSNSVTFSAVVPVVVMLIVMLSRSKSSVERGVRSLRLPSIGSGQINVPVLGVASAAVIGLVWIVPVNWVDAISLQACTAIIVLSLVIITGYCGQLSLAQFAFAGFAPWVAGQLISQRGWPLPLGLLASLVAVVAFGLLIGIAGTRTRGLNLAMVTLAFAVALDTLVFSNIQAQGTIAGMITPRLQLLGQDQDLSYLANPQLYVTFTLLVLVLLGVATANLRRGRVGRRLIAVRDNERAAAALGINVVAAKLYAFTLGSILAAVGGILLAFRQTTLTFGNGQYSVLSSIQLLQEAVVGGVGWTTGAVAGSMLQSGGVASVVLGMFGSLDGYILLIGGVLLLVTILQGPDGIAPNVLRQLGVLRKRAKPVPVSAAQAEADRSPAVAAPVTLNVKNLVVRYGGVTAVDGLCMNLHPGKVVGLIGPNGAGKTSAIDAITGTTRVASGSILLDGKPIETWPAHARARAGLSQSFQSLELFEDMTVYENILTAAEPRDALAYVSNLAYDRASTLPPAAVDAVDIFGLWDKLNKLPGELPYGRKRLVAIARAASSNPSVLLLDEPAAGLDDATATRLGVVIRTLADARGIAVLLVEHHIGLVLSVADYIYCLDFGEPIAEGTPDQIRRNQRVIDAYLGADSEHSGGLTGRRHGEQRPEHSGDMTGRRHVEQRRGAPASSANLVHP